MFYEKQEDYQKDTYKRLLVAMGNLTALFSDSDQPYLPYRYHENVFCYAFEAENLARHDCSADAKKEGVGIGLKTWVGNNDQKVAEFGKLRPTYANLDGIDLVKKISEYRNERIEVTKRMYDIEQMLYHIVKREPKSMRIFECAFDTIDIDEIRLLNSRGNKNNIYFTDGKHEYHFSLSKNTLFMLFNDMTEVDSFEVDILLDPYSYLLDKADDLAGTVAKGPVTSEGMERLFVNDSICLRLYTLNKSTHEKVVEEKSGLNQWNAKPRLNTKTGKSTPRNSDELYIPYPAEDRHRNPDFFPPKDTSFTLRLPDGRRISAKVCQENGKAIMSNPNSELGEWLLRKVLGLPERKLLTYEMLEIYDIDSVIFTKTGDLEYSIDFAPVGTYEKFYGIEDD